MLTVKTKDITHDAFFIAITTMLFFLHRFIPLIGIIGTLLCPVPIILASKKKDFNQALIISILSAILISILTGFLSGLFFIFTFATSGVAISYCLKKNFNINRIISVSTIVVVISTIALYFSASFFFERDSNNFEMMQKGIITKLETFKADVKSSLLKDSNASKNDIDKIVFQFDFLISKIRDIKYYIPFLLIFSSLFSAIITYMMASTVLLKLNIEIPKLPSMEFLYLPWYYLSGLIAGGFLVSFKYSIITVKIGENLLYASLFLYFIIGIGILKFFLKKMNIPVMLKSFIFILSIFLFQNILFFVGVFDNIADFRNIRMSEISEIKLYGQKRDITEI